MAAMATAGKVEVWALAAAVRLESIAARRDMRVRPPRRSEVRRMVREHMTRERRLGIGGR